MIQACRVCQKKYSTEYRNWYDRYVEWVCSSACFRRILTESRGDGVRERALADPRATRFFSPYSTHLRSGYEREFWAWLLRAKMKFEYEPISFTLADKSRYVPDFLVNDSHFVEVKGLWNSEAKKKFIALNREFYDLPIVVVDRAFLDMLKKGKAHA